MCSEHVHTIYNDVHSSWQIRNGPKEVRSIKPLLQKHNGGGRGLEIDKNYTADSRFAYLPENNKFNIITCNGKRKKWIFFLHHNRLSPFI